MRRRCAITPEDLYVTVRPYLKEQYMLEGKTKILTPLWVGAPFALVTTKDDITAGDGVKHDVLAGKAELATRTTCNVFEHLKCTGVPVAYIGRDGPTTFITRLCTMIPVEVVVRRIASGSYLKRHPDVKAGTVFREPVIEFFYKTTGKNVGGVMLPCDDPLMRYNEERGECDLYLPNKPEEEVGLIGTIRDDRVQYLNECVRLARDICMKLQSAWDALGGTLLDFKIECGVLPNGRVVVADVIDCDSWRVLWNGIQLSKQGYRDGDDLEHVLGVYRLAASLTDAFARR